jgi:signal transduction histidine kinase
VDVSAVVADRVAVWQPLGEEQDVTIVGRCPPGVLARAVEDGLDQILDNLIDNALAAAPAGSSIEVIVDTDTRSAAGAVRIHVLDRGPGLTPTQLAAAFDRFWRAAGAAHDGSGLGLAIVAQLAQASGGEVRLDARVGGGVDAVATLPGLASVARTPS